ncbi:hypothetical protein V5O48_003079 [Marasmius crinis-equi]|uniref:BTB domain-containing protein n=1 Tax=Marasmius crinis-equi TaxID=585013 RepID=A0ABR3FTW8_9AGAR
MAPFMFIIESSLPAFARIALAFTAIATSGVSTALVAWVARPYVSTLRRLEPERNGGVRGIEMITSNLILSPRATRVYDTDFLVETQRPFAKWELAKAVALPAPQDGSSLPAAGKEETIAETFNKDGALVGSWVVKWGENGEGDCRAVGSVDRPPPIRSTLKPHCYSYPLPMDSCTKTFPPCPSTHSFDSPDADIVIVSSSGETTPKEFRLHSSILTIASPFFQDMFSLPQSRLSDNQEVPILPVSEPSSTLQTLFQFVYPVVDPAVETLDELATVLEAAVKYDFLAAIQHLRTILVEPRFLTTAPLRVFAIAWRYDFQDEIESAAKHTLNTDILSVPLTDDLKYITAHTFRRLIDLHRRRASAAHNLLKLPHDIKCPQCNCYGAARYNAPKWWYEWSKRAKEELTLRPSSGVIFRLEFIFQAAAATKCAGCPSNMLECLSHLEKIRHGIDDLPCSLSWASEL